MSKVLDSINAKYSGNIIAEKIDVSNRDNMDIAIEFNVQYVPHLLFVDAKGEVFKQEIGYMQEKDVIAAFEANGIKLQ